ncbi:hypothetical protein l11_14350 [Neisseria weaveri LMG 5135]|nr:hypothetical protein l11_14350 [Neisseria weaveri LMG 5135]
MAVLLLGFPKGLYGLGLDAVRRCVLRRKVIGNGGGQGLPFSVFQLFDLLLEPFDLVFQACDPNAEMVDLAV